MRITIERIDMNGAKPIGNMQIQSFPFEFTSGVVDGQARFVPVGSEVQRCASQSYHVEINQEWVTDFKLVKTFDFRPAVFPESEPGTYRAYGVATTVLPLASSEANEVVTVAVLDACFTLTQAEFGSTKLSVGDAVSFLPHEVSLWNEAI